MTDSDRTDGILRFDAFEVDRRACELRRDGRRIPLQIQPFRVLELLVEHAGEVVTRAELRQRVWPSTVYLDFDHGLNNAITRLRRALEDSAEAPRFIETLPRIGYRFIHPLSSSPAHLPRPTFAAKPGRIGSRARMAGAALLGFAAIVIGVTHFRAGGPMPEGASVTAGPTASAAAYDAYIRGVKLYEQRNKESVRLSIEHLERATELDPGFAAAHAALAVAYASAGGSNSVAKYLSVEQAIGPALAAAERALALDPGLAEAHLALGAVLNGLQPLSAATDMAIEQAYRRAVELAPRNAAARLAFANFLSTRNRSDDAVAQYRRALALDPLSPNISSRLGLELVGLGMAGEGLEYLRKAVELDPWQFNARVRLGWASVAVDDLDTARVAFEAAERISPGSVRSQAGLAFIAARTGDPAHARAILATLLPLAETLDDPFDIAIVYVALEDREHALEWLSRTIRQTRTLRATAPWGLQTSFYDWLRDDPRFAELERELSASSRPLRP